MSTAYSFSIGVAFVQQPYPSSTHHCPRKIRTHQRRNPRGGWNKASAPLLSLSTSNEQQAASAQPKQKWKARSKQAKTNSKKHSYNRNAPQYDNRINHSSEFMYLNNMIVQQATAIDILNLLASRKGVLSAEAGGGKLSTINFSTVSHRIAKYVSFQNDETVPGNDRGRVLTDPRFALFMCSLAEAILVADNSFQNGSSMGKFGARELSNCAWGIAKLQIAPPKTVIPIDLENVEENLKQKCKQVRSTIFEVAKQRASKSASTSSKSLTSSSWVPALSELCGLLVDVIGAKAMKLNPRLFKQQELSNIMYSATIVQRLSVEVFDFVVESIMLSATSDMNRRRDEILKPQEWSLPLWCLAKAGFELGHEEEYLLFLKNLMDNDPDFVENFKPQELSNVAWGAATIISKRQEEASQAACEAALGLVRHAAKELIRRDGNKYNTQELTNLAWGMATLGFGVLPEFSDVRRDSKNSYTYVVSEDPEGDKVLMHKSLFILFREVKRNIRRFKSQELNNICWLMSRLGESDDELFEMIGQELVNPRRKVEATDLTITLWSMATEYVNDDLYKAIATRLSMMNPRLIKPNEFSNAVWAFATAGVLPDDLYFFDSTLLLDNAGRSVEGPIRNPINACLHMAAEEVRRRPHSFKPQELKDVLWSFVKLGMRHPPLFKFVAEHLVGPESDPRDAGRGLDQFDAQGIANLAYVYARHCQLGAEILQRYPKRCSIPQTGGRLACYTVSYLDVGEGLLRKLYSRIGNIQVENKGDIALMNAQNVANVAWGFAINGIKHREYFDAVVDSFETRMRNRLGGSFGGQEIANTLWALATLNHNPKGLLSDLEDYISDVMFPNGFVVEDIAKVFTRQELANLAFSLCVFGEYPLRLVELLYTGILGSGDRNDPSYMRKVYADGGIDEIHINSLIYLQIMLDLEVGRGNHPFSLPEEFPQGWSEDPAFSSFSSDDVNIAEINTSNTQVTVSKAFDRIGFPHVDEYFLTMRDLVEQFGINMGAHPVQVLSMDIANVESRIGIELDGPGHWVSDITNEETILNDVGFYRPNKNGILEYKFFWNSDSQEINGSTALKCRMFEKMGWRIINIPFWDWTEIYGNDQLEEDYAQSVLNEVL